MAYTACTQLHPISIHLSGANIKKVSVSPFPLSSKKFQLPPRRCSWLRKTQQQTPYYVPLSQCVQSRFIRRCAPLRQLSVRGSCSNTGCTLSPSISVALLSQSSFVFSFLVVISVTPRWYSWIRLPALSQCLCSPNVQVFFLVHILCMYVPLVVVSCSISCQVKSRRCEPITPVRGYGCGGQECSSCCCP